MRIEFYLDAMREMEEEGRAADGPAQLWYPLVDAADGSDGGRPSRSERQSVLAHDELGALEVEVAAVGGGE
jgi:hypothetical protein